jgi:hypothetical protein
MFQIIFSVELQNQISEICVFRSIGADAELIVFHILSSAWLLCR